MRQRLAPLVALAIWKAIAICTASAETERTYWVWHRPGPLSAGEIGALQAQGVRKLYWHVGSLAPDGSAWRAEAPLRFSPEWSRPLTMIPVVRLSVEGAPGLGDAAAETIGGALSEVARRAASPEVQLDFDCPDRLLHDYALLLGKCRARLAPVRLSATALAGWGRRPQFAELQQNVDALLPMFYDLAPDTPAEVLAGTLRPLLDAKSLESLIASWQRCRIPWHAGLPNYARITIFNEKGFSRGHLRGWEWDQVCFCPELLLRATPTSSTTLFALKTSAVLANTSVAPGETVACRWPDLQELRTAMQTAQNAGAAGIALFRLPGEGASGGWSLSQAGALWSKAPPPAPACTLRRTGQVLELLNASLADLAPRLSGPAGPQDRGWQLELESSAGAIFRETSPGEFAAVYGHIHPDAPEPVHVPIPLAERLTYWFAALPAGQSRQSGLWQLAPGADPHTLHWRIPASPQNSAWSPLE